jgi:hypothetical protein
MNARKARVIAVELTARVNGHDGGSMSTAYGQEEDRQGGVTTARGETIDTPPQGEHASTAYSTAPGANVRRANAACAIDTGRESHQR